MQSSSIQRLRAGLRMSRRLAGFVAVALLAGCSVEEAPRAGNGVSPANAVGAVARVDGEPVLVGDLQGRMPRDADLDDRLEYAIARKLAAREARRRELDESATVGAAIERIRSAARRDEEQILREALHRDLLAEASISEADLQRHYLETSSRYLERRYRFRRLAFSSESEARGLDATLGASGRLDVSRAEEIGPVVANALPRDMLPDALRLRTPGARVVMAGDPGWQVVELVEVLPGAPQPLDAVRERVEESLRQRLAQQAFEAMLVRLRAESVVEVDDAALGRVEIADREFERD